MKIFVIHSFEDQTKAKKNINQLGKELSLSLHLTFLKKTHSTDWKPQAENAIYEAEAVIVFNPEKSKNSSNVEWEIKKAEEAKKDIIEINDKGDNKEAISQLTALYNLSDEFEKCFDPDKDKSMELYRIMVESSERLIERRQKTNAFFITVIGSLLAIAGFLVQTNILNSGSMSILYGFSATSLLLCYSWKNLIDNYGKLNKAKFDVILRIEKEFSAEIYSAEWISLGKGLRPKKYKSFTSTEKNVPKLFGALILSLTGILFWYQFGDFINSIFSRLI
ncbi:RipA family octameric membrane protein [Salibacterium halotolerans]|uniref:Thoeris protein ThsB TIR-like domain-containing protein n=1 Tax=Salibacterium halotolerans TaxID=1884432 RepID=A0A1I5PSN1_9BACI|nr:TIR domain-containing protein [Salibacterium halotolerans]SFP37102.1 hypothetical protein SAMN05518683_104217 [Salibacterium halotolerans]